MLVVGAGSGGQMVVREMQLNPNLGTRAIGFIDDDPRKRGMRLLGLKVLGSTDEIESVLDRTKPDEVIVAIPSAPGVLRGAVVAACRERSIPVRTLPTVFELLRGGVQLTRQLREVRVEDVLGRDPVVMELDRVGAYLEDKIVLVTGAGGSIGSELSRQIARVRPRLLVLLDHAEDNLFAIDREMLGEWHFSRVESVLADCKEPERMLEVMERFKPDVVFHAAAYKHVPLMESNPLEAVRNNAIATRVTAETAAVAGRRALRARLDRQGGQPADGDGRLEGDGGVDRRGGGSPPSRDALRHRALRQRARLVGQRRPDLPQPDRARRAGDRHRPRDDPLLHDDPGVGAARDPRRRPRGGPGRGASCSRWASRCGSWTSPRNMIRLAGYEPERDIAIEITGKRPGEKLSEELFNADERSEPTRASRIVRAVREHPLDADWVESTVADLERLVVVGRRDRPRRARRRAGDRAAHGHDGRAGWLSA